MNKDKIKKIISELKFDILMMGRSRIKYEKIVVKLLKLEKSITEGSA